MSYYIGGCQTYSIETDVSEFGRLSHTCASSGRVVSVILMSTVGFTSQSYRSKLWFKRLNHISLNGKPRVSLISVSIGQVWRSHKWHPLQDSFGWYIMKHESSKASSLALKNRINENGLLLKLVISETQWIFYRTFKEG